MTSFPWLPFLKTTNRLRHAMSHGNSCFPVFLDYPVAPRARYGWGQPAHPQLHALIDTNRQAYEALLRRMPLAALRGIADKASDLHTPYWDNPFVQGLDAVSLYAFPALFGSRQYLEIGSGHSTKFVRQSIRDHQLPTTITSIDPVPRAEINDLCDEIIRTPLEKTDPAIVDRLNANDVLMFDGSHRCFQNSDVHVFFLEVLPRLKPGVLVFIHDMFLPYDYRPEWAPRWYSEQYMLAVLLLADRQRRYEILLPSLFIDLDPELRATAEASWTEAQMPVPLAKGATSFWLRVRDEIRH